MLIPLELAVFPWGVVLFQTVCGITLSTLLAEVLFFDFRKIPFSCGYFPSRSNLVWLIAIYVGGLVLYGSVFAAMEYRLLRNPDDVSGVLHLTAICVLHARWHWLERALTDSTF